MAELIVAFDLPSGREALALAGRLPSLKWAKIGSVLFGRAGPPLIAEFIQRGIRVFLDLKWHDIPNVVASAVTAARELGVSMATVHALGGRTMLTAAAQAAGSELALVGVTVLTSHDAGELEGILGRGVPDVGFEAERLARTVLQAGLRGVVTSGRELGLLREALGPGWVGPVLRAQSTLPAAADRAKQAWLAHDARQLIGQTSTLVLQLPGADPSGALGRAQAVALVSRYFEPAEERGLDIATIREVEPGKGFVEVVRRYVVRGTTELRHETLYFGYRKMDNEWRLVELRSAP